MTEKMAYRLVDNIKGNLKFLYHGIGGSKVIPLGEWLTADRKSVTDGSNSTIYESGFHVFLTRREARAYISQFRSRRKHKLLVPVKVQGLLRRKEHSRGRVFLTQEIFFDKKLQRSV